MLLGQFMELQGEVILRLHSPQSSQVFSETLEVSGRSGMVIGWLDKITSESAPTDKASTSNTMFSRSYTRFLECSQQSLLFMTFNIFRRHSVCNACQDLFHFLLFFLLFSLTVFPQIPPMFFKPSGHRFTFFQALKAH